MHRLKQIESHVEADGINVEKYTKEMANVCWDMFRAVGAMFEQEHLRTINLLSSYNTGATGGKAGKGANWSKGIMEHRVIQNMKAVNGDKALFRQWHQKLLAPSARYAENTRRL